MRNLIFLVLVASSFLVSCARKEPAVTATEGPHASIVLKDGGKLSGMVVASTPTELRVMESDKTTRLVPVNQIRSIQYDEAAPEAKAMAAASAAPEVKPAARPAPAPVAVNREPRHYPTEAAITTKTHVLPVGTEIQVRTDETIDSGKAAEGQTFAADVARDVMDESGDLVIPRGSNAQIVIKSASKGGRFKGASDLILDMQSVSVDGRQYQIDTVDLQQKGKDGVGLNARTGKYAGAGAAVGAIIGAIAGGGKGAAIGAGSGAGAGVVTEIITKGGAIKVPAESILTFKLDRSLRVAAKK